MRISVVATYLLRFLKHCKYAKDCTAVFQVSVFTAHYLDNGEIADIENPMRTR